ncbi:hypothetical protein SAMN05421819_3830 [Bryocella elongata]|uniref:Uncharacterized protein n=1 Tax=Bryocella elongata TaxID=863522 RepID=A0A1H6BM26_9BACT|nr:hypothetical protein [Bryocella elongata]SEG61702.1 hypothetical protein SAMN05421819_3830 [Bryocella elongata]
MQTKVLLEYANIAEVFLSIVVMLVMWRRRVLRNFPVLGVYLGVQTFNVATSTALIFFRKEMHLNKVIAYDIYFWTYWFCYAVQAVLLVFIIRSVFSIAMKPLEGLQQLGKIIFRWIVAVSIVLSVVVVAGNLVSWANRSMMEAITTIASQVHEGTCILTLCLLLFVCFAAHPLGLTPRSRIFGVSLGLGIIAATNLVQAAWYTSNSAHNLYSPVYFITIGGSVISLIVWGTYFALPEPERRMILLPTTSPFFFWNKVSEALGDDPGHVAVAGFTPDMLAPGELTVLTAMSKAARARDTQNSADALAHMNELHSVAQ